MGSAGRWLGALTVCLAVVGCGPAVSDEELGTLVVDPSKIPGAEEPYDPPQLDSPLDAPTAADDETPAEQDSP